MYISTAIDGDDRGLKVLAAPHVFFKILTHATLEATVALYLALHPDERNTFFRPHYYAQLVRLLDRQRTDRVRLQLTSGHVDFASYVKFRHLHLHGLAMEKSFMSGSCYAVDAFHSHPVLPTQREVLVVDCLFLPATAPGRLSNNLVVLGCEGELFCYAPGESCFRQTLRTTLNFPGHSLVSSPQGSKLLVVGEKYVCLVRLAEDGVDVSLKIRIPERIHKHAFGGHCFVDERSFLTMDTLNHQVVSKWTYCEDTQSLIRRVWLKVTLPPLGGLDPPQALVYKRSTEDTEDCLIVSARPPGQGHGNRLGLIFDFFEGEESPQRQGGQLVFYQFTLPSCVISDHTVHPDQKRAYIAVITRLSKEEFFADVPVPLDGEECTLPPVGVELRGAVAVYEMNFITGRKVKVLPKFYLDQLEGTPEEEEARREYPGLGTNRRLYISLGTGESLVKLKCQKYNLTVKLDCGFLAHIPLVSGPASTVCYHKSWGHFTRFCFSEDQSFGAVFRGYLSMGNDFMTGLKGCPLYNVFPGDAQHGINVKGLELLPCQH
jgi:hypothetical protein